MDKMTNKNTNRFAERYLPHITVIILLILSGCVGFISTYMISSKHAPDLLIGQIRRYGLAVGLSTGLLGYITKYLSTKYEDLNQSLETLLAKIEKGTPINPKIRKRLYATTIDQFKKWQSILVIPEEGTKREIAFFQEQVSDARVFLRIPVTASERYTSCRSDNGQYLLYFDMFELSQGEPEIKEVSELSALVRKKIEMLNEFAPSSEKLIRQFLKEATDNAKIWIWVKVPNYTITTIESFEKLLNELDAVFKNYIDKFKLVVEVYMAKHITKETGQINLLPEDLDHRCLTDSIFPAAHYACLRNIASKELDANRILGKPDLPKNANIPYPLLQKRQHSLVELIQSLKNTILVNGSAGAGKTELVELCVRETSKTSSSFFIYCNDPRLERILEKPDNYESKRHFLKLLLDNIEYEFPETISDSEKKIRFEAFRDCFFAKIFQFSHKMLLIIDDLDSNSALKDTIIEKNATLTKWGIRLIIISRSVLRIPRTENISSHEVKLWNKEEAIAILEDWKRSSAVTNETLLHYINDNENSTYLLRIIAIRGGDDKTFDQMMKDELIDVLEPIKRHIENASITPEQKLLEIKNLISNETRLENTLESARATLTSIKDTIENNNQIPIISITSKLAWYSKFNIDLSQNEDNNNPTVSKFNSGRIYPITIRKFIDLTPEQAEQFIKKCVEAKILNDGGKWSDNLVPDGCIASELRKELEVMQNTQVIPKLLEKLNETNSLSFFTSLLDVSLFARLLEICNSNPDTILMILSPNVIKSLSVQEEQLNDILKKLFIYSTQLQFNQKSKWISIVSQFYKKSEYLRELCKDRLLRKENVEEALSVIVRNTDLDTYFQDYVAYFSIEKLLSVALQHISSAGWVRVINALFDVKNPDDQKLQTAFEEWIRQMDCDMLTSIIAMVVGRLFANEDSFNKYALLAKNLLATLFEVQKEKYRTAPKQYDIQSVYLKTILGKYVEKLFDAVDGIQHQNAQENTPTPEHEMFCLLIKWYSYHFNKELVNLQVQLFAIYREADTRIVVPALKSSINMNIAGIRDTINKGFPVFRLAKSTELTKQRVQAKLPEFVSDGFPRDYNYSKEYVLDGGSALKKWTGKYPLETLTDRDRESVAWRAVFILPSEP